MDDARMLENILRLISRSYAAVHQTIFFFTADSTLARNASALLRSHYSWREQMPVTVYLASPEWLHFRGANCIHHRSWRIIQVPGLGKVSLPIKAGSVVHILVDYANVARILPTTVVACVSGSRNSNDVSKSMFHG